MENLLKIKNMLCISPLQSYDVKNGSVVLKNGIQTKNGSFSPTMLYPTPNNSQTPCSTCPPTPGTDYKVSISVTVNIKSLSYRSMYIM